VVRWKLRNLMQKTYGKYDAPISKRYYGKPHTPSAWASFITGKSLEEHGVDWWWSWGRFLDWVRLKSPFKWIKGKRKIIFKLGLKQRLITSEYWQKRDIKTLFDIIKPSIPLFVPTYNENLELRKELNSALKKGLKVYEERVWKIHQVREREVYKRIDEDWKLFMVWFDLVDLLGHLHMARRPYKLYPAYMRLDDLTRKLKRKIPPETTVLIVSDHGMEPSDDGITGDHSINAFWSLNIKTDWKPKKITDFYPKILEWCGIS